VAIALHSEIFLWGGKKNILYFLVSLVSCQRRAQGTAFGDIKIAKLTLKLLFILVSINFYRCNLDSRMHCE
jgi:hypothetical protein